MNVTNNVYELLGIAHAQRTGTVNGAILDVAGYARVEFFINISAVGAADADNYFTFKVYESDASDMTGQVEITSAYRFLGTQLVLNATTMAATTKKFGVTVGTKRYIRLTPTETATADATFGAVALLSPAMRAPVA